MISKKVMLIAIFIAGFLAVSTVSANDLNETDEIAIEEMTVNDSLEITQDDAVSTTHIVDGNTFEDIQNTVYSANSGDTISLSGTYMGNGERIIIDRTLTIEGSDATLDAKNSSGILLINASDVLVSNVNFVNGNTNPEEGPGISSVEYNGGAVNSNFDCIISDCNFKDCISKDHGGALQLTEDSQVFDSYFENCLAGMDGGAIRGGYAVNCNFINCTAGRHGGGDSNGYVNDSFFSNCHADADGGGTSECSVFNCIMLLCTAGGDGGAMYMKRYQTAMNCTFERCSSEGEGGATYGGNTYGCTFKHNSEPETVRTNAGGMVSKDEDGNYIVNNTTFATVNFAIDLAQAGDTVIVIGNCTGSGSPISISKSIKIIGKENAVLDAKQLGLILSINADDILLANLTFTNGFTNSSDFYDDDINSGAVQATGNNIVIQNCRFISNEGFLSGAIELIGDSDIIRDCYFENNSVNLENGYSFTKFGFDEYGRRQDTTYDYSNTAGALRWQSNNGLLENCEFIGNSGYVDYIFVGDDNVVIENRIKIFAADVTKYNGGFEKFTVTLTNKDVPIGNADVKISVNGKTSHVKTDSKGQASMELDLPVGTYDVVSIYGDVSSTSKVTVKSTLTTNDAAGEYLNSKVTSTFLNVDGNALVSKKVTFKINGKEYSATTNGIGVATADVDLGAGNYTVNAVNPVNNEEKTFKLAIYKASSKIGLASAQSNGVTTLTATLAPASASGNVVFNVKGENRNVAVSNGKATLTLKDLEPGNYTVTASYDGDKNLNASASNTVTFNVAESYPVLSANPVTKTYGTSNNLIVYLKDNKGNAIANAVVNVNINNRITSITTDSNGGATMPIGLSPGSYTATVTYADAKATAKITVKKATVKMTAKAKTFKKSVKTKKYTITLKTNQNKIMKNTKVTIKVNKKTCSAKTNNKGVATFKLKKLTKKGKYTATVTYKGSSCYNKLTKKVKITVK